MSTILVTGATGFIGTHLCKRLVTDGNEVIGISRDPRPLADIPVHWWQADLRDHDATYRAIRAIRPEIIFHLASRVTGSRDIDEVVPVFKSNLESAVNVLVSAAKIPCKRVVLAGSSEGPKRLDAAPCSPYAAAKCSSTAYARMFDALFHVPVVVPRVFMTYGPGQQDTKKLIPYTIVSMLEGETPKLANGKRLVDWIYIDDVVEGLVNSAFMSELDELSFDLGSGSLVSIRTVAEQISEIIGNGVVPEFGALPDRPLEPEEVADTSFMKRAFRWSPSTLLRSGLEQSVEWYKHAHRKIAHASVLWTILDISFDLFGCIETVLEAQA